jgi:hypothetical protein
MFVVCRGPRTQPVKVLGPFPSRERAMTEMQTFGLSIGAKWWIGAVKAK